MYDNTQNLKNMIACNQINFNNNDYKPTLNNDGGISAFTKNKQFKQSFTASGSPHLTLWAGIQKMLYFIFLMVPAGVIKIPLLVKGLRQTHAAMDISKKIRKN